MCAAAVAPPAAAAADLRDQIGDVARDPDAGYRGAAGRVGRDVLADAGRVLHRRAARASARKPARATIRGATTTASAADDRAVGQPHPGQPVVDDLERRDLAVDDR